MTLGPRRISDREIPINLAGYFMPMVEPHVPVLIGMPGTDDLFVFVFATEEALSSVMRDMKIPYARMARVTDGRELFEEMETMNQTGQRPYRVRIAIDPWLTDKGKVRFVEPLKNLDVEEQK